MTGSFTRRRVIEALEDFGDDLEVFRQYGVMTTGTAHYVDSATGADDTLHGTGKAAPYATLAYAISRATAAKGDVIYLMPGHAETLETAAAVNVSVSGLTIVGLGAGRNRPVLTFEALAAASLDITAANTTFKNVVFKNNIDAQTAMINVTAADVTFDNCEFEFAAGNVTAILGILTAATATRLRVENCFFHGPLAVGGSTGICTACIKHEVGEDYIIRNNIFVGDLTQAVLNATVINRGVIDNNRFLIGVGTKGVAMHASSTPFITNNRFNVASGTTPIVAAAGFVAGNVYSAAAGVTAGTASTF